MADIGERIFEAIDIIIQERVSGLKFDKTITGVIESIDGTAEEGKENKYIVNDGSTKHTAYSNNIYKVNTSVYISVPNGDYTQKKFIVGYSVNQNEAQGSALEVDQFVNLTGPVWSHNNEITLLANDKSVLSKEILWEKAPEIEHTENDITSINYNNVPMGYSRLHLSAEVSTLFGTTPVAGIYGIRGSVIGKDPKGIIVENPIEFSTKEGWFGDYYNFDGWWPQESVFELKNTINSILSIKLEFYQGLDEQPFISASGKQLAYQSGGEKFNDNIKVRNIQVSLGYSKSELSGENNLMVYAKQDNSSVGQIYYSDATDFKNPVVKARLVHWDNILQQYKEYNTWEEAKNIFAAYNVGPTGISYPRIEWYANRIESVKNKDTNDILASANLEKINGEINTFELALSGAIDDAKASNNFKAALQYINKEKLESSFPEDFTAEDLQAYLTSGEIETPTDKQLIAATLIKLSTVTVQSSFIEYTDEAKKDAAALVERATDLYVAHVGPADKYKGRYNIYHNGELKNSSEAFIDRVLEPKFKHDKYKLEKDCTVVWKVPAELTMINSDEYKVEVEDGYKTITLTVNNKTDSDELDPATYQLIYRIQKQYSPIRDTNNIIKCQVSLKDGTTFNEVAQEIFFGTTGAIGTNYGIEIKLEREYTLNNGEFQDWEDDSILYAVPSSLAAANWVKVVAELHHSSKTISSQPKFKWEFLKGNTKLKLYDAASEANENYIRWADDVTDKVSTNSILKVSCEIDNLKVEEYFPIPSKLSSGVDYLNCFDKIVYSSNGTLKQYYADKLELVYNKTYDNISYISLNTKDLVISDLLLKPVNIYASINSIQCIQAKFGNSILWSQPIYVYQDKWPSEVLNQWDGSLTINENNGTILSAMMAAGEKDGNNTFTGVVMGQVQLDDGPENGLFGFNKGIEAFGFKSNGTAFIGSSAAGQIKFEGDSGTIKSGNYKENEQGMLIDLSQGAILTPNFKLTQDGTESQKGNIAGWDFNDMSLVAPNKTIALYSDTQPTKTEIAGFSSDEWRLTIGDNFGVTAAGVMYASIPGQATEVSGSIVEQLNTLASDHQTIEDDIDGIEDRLDELEKNISPVTPGGNNRYLNQRVSDLEEFVGEKDEADTDSRTLYQRVVALENWKNQYKAESITWITGFTPETETITVPDGDGTKEITVITGITTTTKDITVLMEK